MLFARARLVNVFFFFALFLSYLFAGNHSAAALLTFSSSSGFHWAAKLGITVF
jgi:hypothetical protein